MTRFCIGASALAVALFGCGSKKEQKTEPKKAPEAARKAPVKPKPSAQPQPSGDQTKLLGVGTSAPDFEVVAHDSTKVKLSELRGKPVVLYFYPKDETPGCIAEAESFRDSAPDFSKHDAVVIGVSLDSIDSHKQFAQKYKLSFPLIADTDHDIADKYGVATRNGFAERVTFVIDRQGVIAKVFPQVMVTGHSKRVLEAVAALPKD